MPVQLSSKGRRDPDVRDDDHRRVERAVAGVFVVSIVAAVVLYGRHGHGFVADDWEMLRNARFGGASSTGGAWLAHSRPGAWLTFLLTFGLVGDHPGVMFAIAVLLTAAIAAALVSTLASRLGVVRSVAIALVWVVIPNHTALFMWASTLNVLVAVLLLIVGLHLVADGRDDRAVGIGIALLVASVLTYEITLVVAVAAIVILEYRNGWRRVGLLVSPLLVVGLYSFVSSAHTIDQPVLKVRDILQAEFGTGLGLPDWFAGLCILAVALFAIAALVRLGLSDRSDWRLDDQLVALGLAVIVLGLLPALRTGSNLQGLGDRINAVASIGVAMVLVGIVAALAQVRPAVALAAGALLLVAAVPVANRQSSAAKWASTQVIVAAESPTLYVNPSKGSRDGITGAEGSWTVSAARELLRNNSNAIACVPPRGPHGSPGNDATYSLAQCGKDAPGGPPPT